MSPKISFILFIILPISAVSQVSDISTANINLPTQTRIEVLYDSLLQFIYPTPSDSVYYSKVIYEYDNVCHNISKEQAAYWNLEGEFWQNVTKNEYRYDDRCNKTLYAQYSWDNDLNEWKGFQKYEYFFSDTVTTETIYNRWDRERKDFDGQIKFRNYFDNGRQSIYEVSLWDNMTDDWYMNSRNYFEYNTLGEKFSDTEYLYDRYMDTWNLYEKTIFHYSIKDRDSIEITYNWDIAQNLWVPAYKMDYLLSDSIKTMNSYTFDRIKNIWFPCDAVEETYDNKGNLHRKLIKTWDFSTSLWHNINLDSFEYDNLHRQILHIFYTWNSENNYWVNNSKETRNYDNLNHLYQYQFFNWQNDSWILMNRLDSVFNAEERLFSKASFNYGMIPHEGIKFEYYYNNDGIKVSYNKYYGTFDEWKFFSKGYYFWTHTITNYKKNDIISNLIYPNPAHKWFSISGINENFSIEVIDLNGHLKLYSKLSGDSKIAIESFSPGMYIVNIYTSKFLKQEKLCVF